MTEQHPFKWRHFQSDIILLGVRWYARYPLSYRDLEEMMLERSLHVDHTTIDRWVQQYAPELERRCQSYLKPETDSWRVDETYIKVKKAWVSLYRAVDSQRNTLDFWFSPTRKAEAAKRFFLKTLEPLHAHLLFFTIFATQPSRVMLAREQRMLGSERWQWYLQAEEVAPYRLLRLPAHYSSLPTDDERRTIWRIRLLSRWFVLSSWAARPN